jgi:hypothetical protein
MIIATKFCRSRLIASAGLLSIALAASVAAPERPGPPAQSVGRGVPVSVPLYMLPATRQGSRPSNRGVPGPNVVGPYQFPANPGDPEPAVLRRLSQNGDTPAGGTATGGHLHDEGFYKDRSLWSDRYFRCNSSIGIEQQRGANGLAPPRSATTTATAAWGHCRIETTRARLSSAHIPSRLPRCTRSAPRGGTRSWRPDRAHPATVPGEWTGRYGNVILETAFGNWYGTVFSQVLTILSLPTPEYQARMVQQAYHQSTTAASQWPAQYCWPEGFMRRWHVAATSQHNLLVTPKLVQITTGSANNFVTDIHVGRSFNMDGAVPRLGQDVPRWYGETIGFWDGDVLVTWTSNIQGWTSHSQFEFSSRMQTIEIYLPRRDANGTFLGLNHEAIFYDPEALVEPIRIVRNLTKVSDFDQGDLGPSSNACRRSS